MATLDNPDVTTARQIIEMVKTHGYYVVMAEFEDYSAEAHRYLTHTAVFKGINHSVQTKQKYHLQ